MGRTAAAISLISYRCDLRDRDGLVVPLGFVAEVVSDEGRALGIIARPELTKKELEQVGELSRRLLEHPFDYLGELFKEAWDNAPGKSLAYLADQHWQSLCGDIRRETRYRRQPWRSHRHTKRRRIAGNRLHGRQIHTKGQRRIHGTLKKP